MWQFKLQLHDLKSRSDSVDKYCEVYSVTGSIVHNAMTGEKTHLPYRTAKDGVFKWDVEDAADPLYACIVPAEDQSLRVSAILPFKTVCSLDFAKLSSLPIQKKSAAPSELTEGE